MYIGGIAVLFFVWIVVMLIAIYVTMIVLDKRNKTRPQEIQRWHEERLEAIENTQQLVRKFSAVMLDFCQEIRKNGMDRLD